MIQIDEILSTALLGTSSRKVDIDGFPGFLRSDVAGILDRTADYEDGFLKAASMVFACANSGAEPLRVQDSEIIRECLPDARPVMQDQFVSLLIYLNDNGLMHLFRYALWVLRGRGLVFPHYALPYFVNMAYAGSGKYIYQYRFALWPLLGNRGKWLVDSMGLGGDKFVDSHHPLRLRMFVAMRKAAFRASALQLKSIWDTAAAKHKKDFLSVFLRVWDEDLDFLWDVFSSDDSADVRSMALYLMRRNPNSRVVKFLTDALGRSLTIDGRRHCDFAEPDCVYELSRFGISGTVDKDSGLPPFLAKLPESEVIIFKLIQSVPLSFWTGTLGCGPDAAVKFLMTNPAFKIGFDFRKVIIQFQDPAWAVEHCLYTGRFDAAFVTFLDAQSLDRIADHCDFDTDFRITDKLCGNIDNYEPWGDVFSHAVIQHIIRTRNFDPTQGTVQLMATKLSPSAAYTMQSYISDNYGNDVVVSFFMRISKLRKTIQSLTA